MSLTQDTEPTERHLKSRLYAKIGLLAVISVAILFAVTFSQAQFASTPDYSVKPSPPSAEIVNLANDVTRLHILDSERARLSDWSEDGKLLTTVGRNNLVQTWDIETGTLISASDVLADRATALFSTDRRWAAVTVLTNTIEVLNANTGEVVTKLTPIVPPATTPASGAGYTADAYSIDTSRPIAWSEDSQALLTISSVVRDGYSFMEDTWLIQRWDRETGNALTSINIGGPSRLLEQYSVSPDGNMLAVAYRVSGRYESFTTINLWDTRTGAQKDIAHIPFPSPRPLRWSEDSRTLALIGREVKLIDVLTAQITLSLPAILPPTYTPTPNPNPQPVGTSPGTFVPRPQGSAGPGTFQQPPPVPTTRPPNYVPPATPAALLPAADANDFQPVKHIAWSPDGATVATYDSAHIRFWDASSGGLKAVARHPDNYCDAAEYSASPLGWSFDGRLFATLDCDTETRVLRLWDGRTAAPLRELEVEVATFHWSPAATMLLVERFSTGLELWGSVSDPTPVP